MSDWPVLSSLAVDECPTYKNPFAPITEKMILRGTQKPRHPIVYWDCGRRHMF
eukprot:CAMPEP_0172764408 /NCGR_PEP_ID=MMETSP1074-20121228/177188_1 /TAXON_ID=2916 /ORGANISM="Ceratium fusus, Strain PA161109" /LENGTH=52 /DNA_ID=CAMNT_0013599163 /DNA_START=79 /DNA_END=237 /DNA_ORIENTATION=+